MDINLHYSEQGSGETLILLHGNGEDGSYFAHQMAPFAQHYHVIALDTRGHGQSPRGDAPFTIRQFADDLLALMDEHSIRRAHLLGFSDGGNIALVFTLAHPDRVDKLILDGANLNGKGVKSVVQMLTVIGYRMASFFGRWSQNARSNAEMLGLMVNDPDITPAELAVLDVPTLVIAGTNDVIKDEHTRLIHASIPNAQLVLIEGDHFVAAKNPGPFNQASSIFSHSPSLCVPLLVRRAAT